MKIDVSKFVSKKEMLSYLVANKKDLIEFKKASFKFTDNFGHSNFERNVIKTLNTTNVDNIESGIIKRTIIGNTYNWLDSHEDVHLDGVFSVSIKERGDKIWHLHDHEHKITAKVGKPEKIYEKSVNWTDLGVNKTGQTSALFMDSEIKKTLNKELFEAYVNGEVDQHSVGMIYVKMELAADDEDFKEEFVAWNKYIDRLGNKSKAEEVGYFWAIKEAKLIEISAVLEGSNELTPTIQNIQSPDGADNKGEPLKSTPTFDYTKLISGIEKIKLNN